MNQQLMFVDEMPFSSFADERIPWLNLLKWGEHDITVAVARSVPEVPANWGWCEIVAVLIDGVDVAN